MGWDGRGRNGMGGTLENYLSITKWIVQKEYQSILNNNQFIKIT